MVQGDRHAADVLEGALVDGLAPLCPTDDESVGVLPPGTVGLTGDVQGAADQGLGVLFGDVAGAGVRAGDVRRKQPQGTGGSQPTVSAGRVEGSAMTDSSMRNGPTIRRTSAATASSGTSGSTASRVAAMMPWTCWPRSATGRVTR